MRIIATRTDSLHGLIKEEEFISSDEQLKEIYLEFGWAEPYDPADPLPPKGLNDWEAKAYPQGRFIIKDGSIYKSNTNTSNTWILSEWDIKVQGA